MSEDRPNLQVTRQPPAALDEANRGAEAQRNVRRLLGFAATGLWLLGLRRRRPLPAALLVAATALLYRAAAGHDDVRRARAWIARVRTGRRPLEPVGLAGEASFPASDPPPWTSTVGRAG